jgi:hypothetical protein
MAVSRNTETVSQDRPITFRPAGQAWGL